MVGDGRGAYLEHGPMVLYSVLDYVFFLSELGLHRIRYIHTESHSGHFRKDDMRLPMKDIGDYLGTHASKKSEQAPANNAFLFTIRRV
ncbi:hypothetical protein N7537_006599 [Penicillium hordei]|uniref:Uncharacterized protein n=1 Tax=Penicillium hordei TaxID=40994 RepID=A0AAD6E7X0_9EURO|nr:uncharacterized protein N7537_006599 [Penicillium hordei]KAJ5603643.1 hypothetical protein N7537_006599 [Penicillium hordei]